MKPYFSTSSHSPPLPPPSFPRLTAWDFIWSFFMHVPRARAWLFDRSAPASDVVLRGLGSMPCLTGFNFSSEQTSNVSPSNLPNIGDLDTAIHSADGVILGICFGYRRIMPIFPSLHAVLGAGGTNNKYADGRAVVRRTAMKYISIQNGNETEGCFIKIEFCWLMSGMLAVATCYHGMASGPVLDQGQIRIFVPGEAEALYRRYEASCGVTVAQEGRGADGKEEYTNKNDNDNGRELQPPKNWTIKYSVREPEDGCNPDLLRTAFARYGALFRLTSTGHKSEHYARTYEEMLGQFLYEEEQNDSPGNDYQISLSMSTARLWKRFHIMNERARQSGTYITTVETPNGLISSWLATYHYLVTVGGINIDGRVQELFGQLGIDNCNPDIDRLLMMQQQHSQGSFSVSLCSSADSSSSSSSDGRKVVGSDGKEIWICARCGTKIKGKRGNLKRHILVKHHNGRLFECGVQGCGKNFQNRVNLKRHVIAVHIGRPYKCDMCTRTFKTIRQRDAHIFKAHALNEGDGNCLTHCCETCGRCFDIVGTLNRHRRTVHGSGSEGRGEGAEKRWISTWKEDENKRLSVPRYEDEEQMEREDGRERPIIQSPLTSVV